MFAQQVSPPTEGMASARRSEIAGGGERRGDIRVPALEGVAELTWGAGLGRVADRLTCRLQREDLAVVGDVAERDVADGERPEPGGELRVLLVVEELLAEEHCLVDEQRVAHRLDLPVGERLAQVEPGDLGAARDRLRLHYDDSVGDGGRETLQHLRERAAGWKIWKSHGVAAAIVVEGWRLWRDITRGRPSAPGKTAGWSPAARADRDGASGVDSSFRLTAQGPDGLAGVTQLCKIALYGICIDTQ